MEKQSLTNKQAEVRFRNQLKQGAFTSREPHGDELLRELQKRVAKARKTFRTLKNNGTKFSPFLEIGAERGQRSILLASKSHAHGVMLDLSLESLREAEALRRTLKLNQIPQRVVADAYNLPFPNDSFALIFAFQTIHHFPDPEPILREVNRVLAPGGVFFLDEEPVRQSFNLRLWRRPTKLRWWEKILKATVLLHFLSEIGKSEVDAGIIETSFNLPIWEKALDVFDDIQTTLTVFPFGPTEKRRKTAKNHWLNPSPSTRLLLSLLGGNIQAFCKKGGKRKPLMFPLFACPACPTRPILEKLEQHWSCPTCNATYPLKNGIPLLIKQGLRKKLYPNV